MSDLHLYSHNNICIFSPDTLTALGLKKCIETKRKNVIINCTTINEFQKNKKDQNTYTFETLILYLPKDVPELLFILKQATILLTQKGTDVKEVIIITPYSFNWLYHTLKPLISPITLRKVRAISAKADVLDIAYQLKNSLIAENCLSIQARKEEIKTGQTVAGLTLNEYNCVLDFFCGRSINEPFYSSKTTATSTRYSQRNSGLYKLSSQMPSIFGRCRYH